MIAIDTSVLVDFLRGRKTAPAERLRQMEVDGIPFAIPVLCCQELLQGAKDEREWKLLAANLGSQRLLVPRDQWRTHHDAARIFFDCRRRGLTIRSSIDCLIAQLALEWDAALLHDDEDFERIKKVRPLRTVE